MDRRERQGYFDRLRARREYALRHNSGLICAVIDFFSIVLLLALIAWCATGMYMLYVAISSIVITRAPLPINGSPSTWGGTILLVLTMLAVLTGGALMLVFSLRRFRAARKQLSQLER